jgi:putative transposase
MQQEGLQARVRRRFKCTPMSDHDQPVAANLLDRQFTAAGPNQRWVGDTTEFVIGESGKLFLVQRSPHLRLSGTMLMGRRR